MMTTILRRNVIVYRFWQAQGSGSGDYKNYSLTIMLVTASVLAILLVTPNLTSLALTPYVMAKTSPGYQTVSTMFVCMFVIDQNVTLSYILLLSY